MAPLTDEQIVQQRRESPFYCPGCGKPYGYAAECSGTPTAPHAPTQTVSTDELKDADLGEGKLDPDKLTAAPPSEG